MGNIARKYWLSTRTVILAGANKLLHFSLMCSANTYWTIIGEKFDGYFNQNFLVKHDCQFVIYSYLVLDRDEVSKTSEITF